VHCGVSGPRNVEALFFMLGSPVRILEKAHQDTIHCTCVLHSVGSAGHVVHSIVSGTQNINALFYMLGCDRYGFHKKRAGTHTLNLCFCIQWDMWIT
jgi:hypothetical protein